PDGAPGIVNHAIPSRSMAGRSKKRGRPRSRFTTDTRSPSSGFLPKPSPSEIPSTRMNRNGIARRMISARGSRTSRRRSFFARVQMGMEASPQNRWASLVDLYCDQVPYDGGSSVVGFFRFFSKMANQQETHLAIFLAILPADIATRRQPSFFHASGGHAWRF